MENIYPVEEPKRKLETESTQQSKRQCLSALHTEGYSIYRNFIECPNTVLADLQRQSSRAEAIFNGINNGSVAKGDGKRRQFRLGRSKVMQPFEATLDRKLTRLSTHGHSTWVVIQSKAGCEEQPAHTDYAPQAGLSDDQMPLALLLAVMPNTRLHVWPRSIRLTADSSGTVEPIAKQTIELEPGDAVLFRGDLVHAGAAYGEDNIRMHCYLPSAEIKRPSNSTWLVDTDPVLRAAIQ